MMPTGIEMLFFFPAVLAAYWIVPRRAGAQNAVLLVASYVFYASWSLRLLPVIVAATLIDYTLARFMDARKARIMHGPTEYDRRGASSRRSEEGASSPAVTDERRTDAQQIGGQTTEAHELSGLA